MKGLSVYLVQHFDCTASVNRNKDVVNSLHSTLFKSLRSAIIKTAQKRHGKKEGEDDEEI